MTAYSLLLLLHVLGAIGMFTAWGIEGVALTQLAHATTSTAAASAVALRRKIVPGAMVAMLTAVVTGVWMMMVRWGHQHWEVGAVASLVAIGVIGIVADRRARPVLAGLAESDARSIARRRVASDSLTVSLRMRVTLGVAILALMVVKPDLVWSIAFVAGAAAVCVALAIRGRGAPRRFVGARG